MRTLEHVGAVGVFLLHVVVFVVILFGWVWPSIWPLYMALLVYVLIQNLVLGYCVLSRMEFSLRRILNPKLRYEYNFTTYYTYKLTHRRISTHFVQVAGTFFLATSLAIQTYFAFFTRWTA